MQEKSGMVLESAPGGGAHVIRRKEQMTESTYDETNILQFGLTNGWKTPGQERMSAHW
jgi:hypothetical protein